MQTVPHNPIQTAVILAAGQGKRLQSLNLLRAKAMQPIAGKPMVGRVMDTFTANQIHDFILVINPQDTAIRDYFQAYSEPGMQIRFAYQAECRGMADALACAAPLIQGDFLLSACDNLVEPQGIRQLLQAWQAYPLAQAILTLIAVSREQAHRSGIVVVEEGQIKRIIEKPLPDQIPASSGSNITVSLPLYAFSPHILAFLKEVPLSPRGEYELQDAIQMLIDRSGCVSGLEIPGRMTVTSAEDLLQINLYYLQRGHTRLPNADSISPGCRLIDPVYIEDNVHMGQNCQIGPNVYLEAGSQVGDGARLQNTVLLRSAVVAAGAILQNQILNGPDLCQGLT